MSSDSTGLLTRVAEVLVAALPKSAAVNDGFETEAFVAAFRFDDILDADRRTLEALTRKIEVGRNLARRYSVDLDRRIDPEPVRPEFAVALAAIYLATGIALGDWKWINTAIKIAEGILVEPVVVMPDLLTEAICSVTGDRVRV